MKDEKTKTSVEVKGMETFRRMTTIMTLIGSAVSALIIVLDPRGCETNEDLMNAVIITLSVQLSIFLLLLMHYIHCGCLLRKIGGWLGIFYFILTAMMTWAQFIFMKGEGCMRESVVLYWWLAFNIGCFYCLIAYGLSLWGAYLCWAQQEEEELVNEALKHKWEKMKSEGGVAGPMGADPEAQRMAMIDNK